MNQLINSVAELPIRLAALHLITDSRLVASAQNAIFFAIRGERHDGHQFITDLYTKGVREFVVEHKSLTENLREQIANCKDAHFWQVASSLTALQSLVKRHRETFQIPVVGITGSNGKTIVKEWLAQLLANQFQIVKSPRSYNSQIGVPLSVWQMNTQHTLGIFEAGISKTGEMELLEPIIRPEIGIFTNIGTAHDEGFRSKKQKITEKLRLFQYAKYLIYCADYQEIDEEIRLLLKAVNPEIELVGWQTSSTFTLNTTPIQSVIFENGQLSINYKNKSYVFFTHLTDGASVENITHCIFACLIVGLNEGQIQEGLNQLKPLEMRLALKNGTNQNVLIDDSYSNDLGGLSVALNFLNQQQVSKAKTLVLSDFLQTGLKDEQLYAQVADLVESKGIERLIGVGEKLQQFQQLFEAKGIKTTTFGDTNTCLGNFPEISNSLILLKGARVFEFERIVQHLQEKTHGTVLEIDLNALTHNLNFYRSKLKKGTKIMAMVKAFAYGSGGAEVATLLQYHRVDYLGVAYTDEGIALRTAGICLPIMVLNPQPETFSKMLDQDLEPEIYSFKILENLLQFLSYTKAQKSIKIHLKLDTGMHRLGFVEDDLEKLIAILGENPVVEVASIFSHLVGSDEAQHNEFSRQQIQRFERMSGFINQKLNISAFRHICNTGGIIRFPDAHFDMVRLGIGLYGVEITNTEQKNLETVGTLKTVISQIKSLKKGETVGYSRKGVLEHDARIATIAIGYADGFDRRFSGGVGRVLVNAKPCVVVGNVCMDMTMIDVSDVDCQEGDEVVVFGKNLPIKQVASSIGTIPYEILTGVSERVKRVFYKE